MRWNQVAYALIFVATVVAIFVTPFVSWMHVAVVAAGIAALLVVGRLTGKPWGRL